MIKLTGAVSFPTRMHTEENMCELTCTLKTKRRKSTYFVVEVSTMSFAVW